MAEPQKSRDPWVTLLFSVLLLGGVFLTFGLGLYLAIRENQYTVLALGWLAISIPASVYVLMGRPGGRAAGASNADPRQVELLNTIAERLLLTDQAKRIAYRQKDRDALRSAIVEDIRQEDYAAAMVLVNDMADVYGYREEAEQFRQQIIETQAKKRAAMIRAAADRIDQITARHDWDQAHREVERLRRMYPDYPEVNQIAQRVREARDAYKNDLVREFREAYEREDNNRAADLLQEMDKYLTPEEARPYMEMAREVLSRKRENLGVRFKLAMQDHDWHTAIGVGEQIIREFPNSHFAVEVKDLMTTLRERAETAARTPATER